jgi:hypothetical protein
MFLSFFSARSTSSNASPREKNPGQKMKKKPPPLNEKHEIQQYCYCKSFSQG